METKAFDAADIQVSYCIDLETRDSQVAHSIARIKNRIEESPDHDGHIAVVCYGPSLNDTWEQIRNFKTIITVSGAHKFLLEKGISPFECKWYHCECDPRPHKATLIGKPHKDIEYLCASVCHKDVFDLLEGQNVKLWHIFSHESSRDNIPETYPRGEWCITGGSNVGLRAMVVARFLGFKKMTVFGMDYSFTTAGSQHAAFHPNENIPTCAVEVAGKEYLTNGAMHFYAQQFFSEVQKLGDIDVTVVGDGLLQAQIREHTKHTPLIPRNNRAMIAGMSPKTISDEYVQLNKKLHQDNEFYGNSGIKRADTVRQLIKKFDPVTVLDYGCGKGTLANALDRPIWEYDPCIEGKDASPRPADLTICTDVLEHIEPELLNNVLLDLARCTMDRCYVVINTGPAIKTLSDGRNTHLIQEHSEWWKERLSAFFEIEVIEEKNSEIAAILKSKQTQRRKRGFSKTTTVSHDGTTVGFYTPNQQTEWRATSLFTKEPITIEWINSFQKDEVFYDIGANMGGYSIWAAQHRGVKVFSFEPESGNYAVLCRNITLNQSNITSYCIALSDVHKISQISLASQEFGNSNNTFGSSGGLSQGCVGYTLDELTKTLPPPDHIKIDVDGIEPKVIQGAKELLKSGKVKSILVEVNTNSADHLEMAKFIENCGFYYDPQQVAKAMRQEGTFKGYAEYLFRSTASSVIEFSGVCPLEMPSKTDDEPFRWMFFENIFSPATYKAIQSNLPQQSEYIEIEKSRNLKGYPMRYTASPTSPFWTELFGLMLAGPLKLHLCKLFGITNPQDYKEECLLVRDLAGYQIGPHTDTPQKVITALLYLPQNEMPNAGTSVYIPKEDGFVCTDGSHFAFEKFNRVKTMPFRPNSAFVFARTNNSFHGVEPCNGTRDVLLYDIRRIKSNK